MAILPRDAKRIILSVSPSKLDGNWHKADHDKTITFRSLAAIAQQQVSSADYRCWLISTEQTEQSARFLNSCFSSQLVFGEMLTVPNMESALEIFNAIQNVASFPENAQQTIVCDCTGGNKTMSIAMALACNHYALTGESKTKLVLTYIPRDRDGDEVLFHEVDLFRFVAEEQRRYVEQQEQIGRLHYLARVAPVLAHEIKTPLRVINIDVGVLRRKASSDDVKELLDEIDSAEKQIQKIIRSVQQAVRAETALSPAPPLDLAEAMRRLKERTQKRFPNLILDIRGENLDELRLRITEEKFYSILTNLIDNAAQATEGRGIVTLFLERKNTRLQITVQDNGPGIPPEKRMDLFKPMARGKNVNGTGIGLSIVKTFVDEEGGTIALDEKQNGGACFRIELPLHENEDALR